MEKIYDQIEKYVKRIQKHLGAGFKEGVLQNALAKEFIDSKIKYEKELNLDILYKKNRIGYITPDFYIPKQNTFDINEDFIIETKQAPLKTKVENLSQLKIYLKSRRNHFGYKDINKAMIIYWENKDLLNENENHVNFSIEVLIEVWELSKKSDSMKKIWTSKK